ncbi:MAG TPA: isoprenylcysteine carboxylmethyltransferase family protein [Vicinamibacterales bacterium]|nr:isoprenylcysteine carboxylmethyltransferase family protein [Vicinamibacterales bacterium]
MAPPDPSQPEKDDWVVRLGGWLFARRTSLPVPIVLLLLLLPSDAPGALWGSIGTLLIVSGELLRILGVRQIGVISRTRSDRLGPLIASGPFAYVRNPLYLGNIALWVGFAVTAGLPWLAPIVAALLAFVYHAIVRWEEGLLTERLGDRYRGYMASVPRWLPRFQAISSEQTAEPFSWTQTLFSERGTLIAILAGYLLLAVKFAVQS